MHPRLFDLTDAQALVRDTARSYAQKTLVPVAARLDREAAFPREQLAGLAELGLMGVNVPERYGGAEAGAVAYVLAMMEIAQGCASTAVTMAVNNLVAETIVKFGTEEQKRRYVPEITSGRFVAASFGLSEPHAGSDAGALRTTARRDGGDYVLNGSKQWITSGDQAGVIIVWARTGEPGTRGISAFLVEGGSPGLHVGRHEDKMGLRASSTVSLSFEDVRVPASAMLGAEGRGFPIALAGLDSGRVGIACQAIGIARAALDESIRYAKDRKAFGQPIGSFQAIQFMLADVATELDAATLLALRAAALKEAGKPFTSEGSMAKVFASEKANRACDIAVQIHGGYGYIDEFPVERHYRDVRITTIYEGSSEIQRIVIARNLLRE
ncbi:MAG TPA: acyl-CoA dehydrogenase family protein [Myxococcales bacterium]|nr:acyl-CoA dehydrogenase family protein [Myxococcales bacterium]